jgi:CTP:molybdopterin cytidylyltransferase MocA
MRIAAVILAAGAATRFGSPKQLARIGGRTMLEAVAAAATDAGLQPVIAVVPPDVPVPPAVVPVINDAPAEGLSRSLRLGVQAVPVEADAAVILLGDQPTIDPLSILSVVDAASVVRPVAAAEADGVLAPPVMLMRSAFDLVDEAAGDAGLRAVLDRRRDEVAAVPVDAHPPDVDTPADLERLGERCPGCGGLFEPLPGGETHEYLESVPGCWAAFSEVLAREFGDPAYGWIHRHTVDAYAAQHPGVDGRRQRQSVAIHLIGLCQWLEHGLSADRIIAATGVLTHRDTWPWLTPPARYRLTVLDVLAATSADEHARLVRSWAEAVWEGWSDHHAVVRGWAADALADAR